MNRLVWKLLRRHISGAQLAGFFLASLFGMSIVLLGIQFYRDVAPVFTQGNSFLKKDYLIATRKISTLGNLTGRSNTFSPAAIDDLRNQPFTRSVGAFTPSLFDVSAGLGMQEAGIRLSTEMFFESVPDAYIDVNLDRWHFDPQSHTIPIIIPRNYLNLYNFGFAQSRSLPKLSEGLMNLIQIDIRLSGNGLTELFKGQIVGFSNRLNTILVPQAFMEWANNRYSTFSLRPIDINLIDVTRLDPNFLQVDGSGSSGMVQNRYLVESFKTQFVGGLSFSYGFNNQRRNLGGNATNIRFNLETAGNLIDAVEHLFWSRPKGLDHYTIFGIRYSQYFRSDLSVSRKVMLGDVTSLVGRLYGGVAMAYGNSSAVPFDRQFYCGGSNGMRGWTPRTLGQGSVPDPHDAFPIQTGDVKLEANLELRFPIWGIVHGATFFDVGNVWYIKRSPDYSDDAVFFFDNFYKQLGFNTGFGLRFDIKFFVLRLDWGIQLHNPNNPAGERWIHNFKWKNTALNFGVGYPF